MDLSSIILVEGPDGGGKTTLARSLATREYLHQGPYKEDVLDESLTLLLAHQGKRLVLDRFHLGEQVYGPIYRGKDKLGSAGRRMLERYLLSRRTLVVLCVPPFDVAHAAWLKRKETGGEMFLTEYERVYRGFDVGLETCLPVLRYDHTTTTQDAFVTYMIARLKELRVNKGPGIGLFEPNGTLLVGEQCSRPDLNPNAQPFVGWGGCAEWLAQRLDEAKVDEKRLYWINALDLRGEWTPGDFMRELNPARVITMGTTAARWLDREKLYLPRHAQILGVNHPQHHKRFRYNEPYALIEALKGE